MKNFASSFNLDSCPGWPCPTCGAGHLRVVDGSFRYEESSGTKQCKNEIWFESDMYSYVYTTLLVCSNATCLETVISSGKGYIDEEYYDDCGQMERRYNTVFSPQFFTPPLKLIDIPEATSEDVVKALTESFSLYFSNSDAAANSARTAIELLLDGLDVPRLSDKNKHLNLHNRIENIPSPHESLQSLFEAVKWIGNDGSHSGPSLKKSHVDDAYAIVEQILITLFCDKSTKLMARVSTINENKGAIKKA